MITLLEAAKDSERTFKESLYGTFPKIKSSILKAISEYKTNPLTAFDSIKNVASLHENPLLKKNQGSLVGNHNTAEEKGAFFLPSTAIQEYYHKGYIADLYKLPHSSLQDIQKIESDYIKHKNRCHNGLCHSVYCKFPDYVGHLYIPSIVKLIHDNYDFFIQKAMSIFNVPEEELFFSVGIFFIDESKKGINLHQDYSYAILDQTKPAIATSLMTFHTAITADGTSRLNLFPGTHKEILHTLPTLRYLVDQGIAIDEDMAMYVACMTNYAIKSNQLPYNNFDVFTISHFARYPQLLYVLEKYKSQDIVGYEAKTKPGEVIVFDPAILHSNGPSSGTIDELVRGFNRAISKKNISRLSLAIRVLHTKSTDSRFLWMSCPEKKEIFQAYFDMKCLENGQSKVMINKNSQEIYTVLSNKKLSSPLSPYFSVNEIYDLHVKSGGYLQ
jgi:hypothetical protein